MKLKEIKLKATRPFMFGGRKIAAGAIVYASPSDKASMLLMGCEEIKPKKKPTPLKDEVAQVKEIKNG